MVIKLVIAPGWNQEHDDRVDLGEYHEHEWLNFKAGLLWVNGQNKDIYRFACDSQISMREPVT